LGTGSLAFEDNIVQELLHGHIEEGVICSRSNIYHFGGDG